MTDETKPEPRPKRCETCAFFENLGGRISGYCCRYPQTLLVRWDELYSDHPPTEKHDFCGEWTPQSWHEAVPE